MVTFMGASGDIVTLPDARRIVSWVQIERLWAEAVSQPVARREGSPASPLAIAGIRRANRMDAYG